MAFALCIANLRLFTSISATIANLKMFWKYYENHKLYITYA